MDLEGHVMLVTARVEFERLSQLFLLRARAFCPGEWLRPRRMEAEEARVVCWRLGLALGFPMRALTTGHVARRCDACVSTS